MGIEEDVSRIELTQVTLGLSPWTLIRMAPSTKPGASDKDMSLFLEAGAGAGSKPLELPWLALKGGKPEGNPLAQMLRDLADDREHDRYTLGVMVRAINPDWHHFVFRLD